MSARLALLALLLLQGQAPDVQDAPAPQDDAPVEAGEPEEPPKPEPWTAPLGDGLAELRAALDVRQREEALVLSARLGRTARELEPDPARAARVLHDVGLARAAVDDLGGALADLRAAAGLAGPGEVRASSLYAAGTARLERAELLRLAVPEIAEELGLPAPPEPPDEAAPDPLDIARRAYLDAREDLLERVRLDARDEDTRANLELVTRRLRELEDIEREREEQEQEQDQQQDPEQEPPEDQEQPPPEDQEQQEQEQQEQDEQEQEQDPEQQPPPEDEPSDEEEQDEQQEQEQQPEDPEESEDESEQQEQEQEAQPQEAELEERLLSKEEVQRLLDQLAEIEAEAEAVRARLRDRRRKPVEKDW